MEKVEPNRQIESVNYDYKIQGPRQHRQPDIVENGAIYMFKVKTLMENSNRFEVIFVTLRIIFGNLLKSIQKRIKPFVELIYTKTILKQLTKLH